jgi:hypothetical protein
MAQAGQGGRSRLALQELEYHLIALESDALTELKRLFRAGELDQVKMLVKVGQLCNLEDIRTRLTADVRRGEHAGKELEKVT